MNAGSKEGKGRAVGSWFRAGLWILDLNLSSSTYSLSDFGPGAFLLCPRCLTCKRGLRSQLPHWMSRVTSVRFSEERLAQRSAGQCWLLQQTLLLGPARISAVFISSSCPSPLLNVKFTQLSSHSLFIFLHKD